MTIRTDELAVMWSTAPMETAAPAGNGSSGSAGTPARPWKESGACGAPHTRWTAPQLVQVVLVGVGEVRVFAVAGAGGEGGFVPHVGPVRHDVRRPGTTAMLL